MFGVFDLLVCIGIGVGISWAEQYAFAEVHQAHQNAGDGDDADFSLHRDDLLSKNSIANEICEFDIPYHSLGAL